MEDRSVLQDLIPDMGQLELAYVPFKEWTIDPDVHSLLYGPGNIACLPTNYGKIVHTDAMTPGVTTIKDGGGGPKIFLEPLPEGSSKLIYVLLFTVSMGTLKTVDYPTFLDDIILNQKVPDGVDPLKYTWTPTLTQSLLKLSAEILV